VKHFMTYSIPEDGVVWPKQVELIMRTSELSMKVYQ
jgi:hypothetical protein